MFSQTCWHFPKIYKLNQKLSKDHKAVGLTINFKSIKENTRYQNSPQHITEKIIVKDLTKEQIENIDKAIKKEINIKEWEYTLNIPESKINVETLQIRIHELIMKIATEHLKIKKIRSNTILKPHKQNEKIQIIEEQERKLIKIILIVEENLTMNHISNKLIKLNNALQDKYKIPNIDITNLQDLKHIANNKLREVCKEMNSVRQSITQQFIAQRVDQIRGKRITNPNEFFKKAQPDNMFNSQQMWSVEFNQTKKGKIYNIISSTPEVVQKKVKEAWETIFSSKKRQASETHKVFTSNKFREIKSKIKNKDQELINLFTQEELDMVMKNISNGTAPGPNRIPNELLKMFYKNDDFKTILLKLLNACLIKKRTPNSWKNSHIFTIYKKGNPNNPLNYRPIALLPTTYKIYSMLINNRLSNFMEKNNCFSNMQGGFRKDRPTYAKIWSLKNVIEHSITKNRELHMIYIDIQKAYDSVEYWALELVLEKYGFSKHFRDIIMDICKNLSCNVVLPYDLSEQINITRGVKQGCPLSLTLFIIFLEPLMLLIEDSNKGYEIDNRKIP